MSNIISLISEGYAWIYILMFLVPFLYMIYYYASHRRYKSILIFCGLCVIAFAIIVFLIKSTLENWGF